MIHESWHGGNHPKNDHVNGSRYGHNHSSKRIKYDNSWYGHNHPSERDIHINITMSHHLATWTFVIKVQGVALQHDPIKVQILTCE